jgi:hypothetical protein
MVPGSPETRILFSSSLGRLPQARRRVKAMMKHHLQGNQQFTHVTQKEHRACLQGFLRNAMKTSNHHIALPQ